jgi:GT2 family glycosyltransferase
MVGIVTVTRNRRAWWPNMVENIQRQRWPTSRLVWVLVDDGDAGQQLKDEVAALHEKVPALSVLYMQVPRGDSLGAKRNAGVAAAAEAGATHALMMDDDDHYPETSVAERMRWLMRTSGTDCVACATIPMYDVTRYISAMNVPPLKLAPAERVSEATVAFRISAAATGNWFSDKSIAEGDGWVGSCYKEMPPMGILVSLIHSGNTSSRRVPEEQEPNGCHYGFGDDYFRYLHTIGAKA